MTQLPYGDGTQPPPYPQQQLLPQQVQPGRSRLPLLVVAVLVVAAVIGGLVVWRLAGGSGDENRAAYCRQLRVLTSAGGLSGLADGGGGDGGGAVVPKAVTDLVALAPDSVRGQWDDLVSLARSATGATPGVGTLARAFSDVQTIAADAKSGCGLDLRIAG